MSQAMSGFPRSIDGLIATRRGSSVVLTSPTNGQVVITNHVGGAIAQLADGSRTLDSIVDLLGQQYPSVERHTLAADVQRFLEEAAERGIMAWSPVVTAGERGSRRKVLPVLPHGGTAMAEHERKFRPDVYWYLTFRCNLACTHCSVESSPQVDSSRDLDTAGCLRVIDQMADLNVSAVLLSGGEVMIRPDALTILEALGAKGIFIGLETNGLRFDSAFVELARDLQSRNLLTMTISLDGGTRATHEILRGKTSFDRTVRGLRLLKDNAVKFSIQCVLNASNYKTIPNLYDLAIELTPACERVIWAVLNATGRGVELIRQLGLQPESFPEIFALIHGHKGRFAGVNLIKMPPAMVPPEYLLSVYKGDDVGCSTSCRFPILGVLPNGDITICALSRQDLVLGNVHETTLKQVWQAARLDHLRGEYVAAERLEGICGDCVWKRICKGSCRAWALKEGEDFYSPFPVCQHAFDKGLFRDEYRISKQGGTV